MNRPSQSLHEQLDRGCDDRSGVIASMQPLWGTKAETCQSMTPAFHYPGRGGCDQGRSNLTNDKVVVVEEMKRRKCPREAEGCGISIMHGWQGQDYTHSEQQWVLADPLNRSYKITLQRNLSVFSASQQHTVLEERKR